MCPTLRLLAAVTLALSAANVNAGDLTVFPESVLLTGTDGRQRLVVTDTAAGRPVDRTRDVTFRSETPAVVAVDADGIVTTVGDGEGIVSATVDGRSARVAVRVSGSDAHRPVTFERDVQAVLTRYGCNAGACHGKARGQNGFQLSLLGFDHAADYAALVQEARGRRVFPAAPGHSLLLRKASGGVAHGGGRATARGRPELRPARPLDRRRVPENTRRRPPS